MDRHETAMVLSILRAAYPNFYKGMGKEDLNSIVNLWLSMFEEDPPENVAAAVKALIATDTKGFPPHIGAVKEKLRQITTPAMMTEQEAWALVANAIRNGTYGSQKEFDALPLTIQRIVGSPNQLKEWAAMDADTVNSVVASNFQRSYRARAQHQRELDALPGDVKAMVAKIGNNFSLDRVTLPEGGGSK